MFYQKTIKELKKDYWTIQGHWVQRTEQMSNLILENEALKKKVEELEEKLEETQKKLWDANSNLSVIRGNITRYFDDEPSKY